MKVILSVAPIRFPLTGIGRYSYELARGLEKNTDISDLRFFSGRRFVASLPQAEEASGGGHSLKRIVQQSHIATEAYRLLMPMLAKQALKGFGEHLFHSPNFFIPPFPGRSVATFHDLSAFTFSQCQEAVRVRFMQKEMRTALSRASALIVDSEFTRREVAEYFAWPLERIHTVPLASSDEFHPRPVSQLCEPLSRYDLVPGQYSLFVGTIEPRKNIETLLDAYGRLPLPLRLRWPLVLTGYKGWRSEAIHQRIEAAQREGWARYLGFVPAADLPLLYSGARLFVFPSLYEGFGLPVLEAMSSGVPVICSNSSSLPEVAGAAALMCAPNDVEGLSGLLQQGLDDELWRAAAVDEGLRQAASFSWQKCADKTHAVYQNVLLSS